MKRTNKEGKKRKLNIKYIYDNEGNKLPEILKEGYLCYIKNLKN